LSKLSLHEIEPGHPAESLPELTMQQITDEIADNEENFRLQITKLETQLGHMKPNLAAIAEYRKKVSLLFSISRHFFSLLVYAVSPICCCQHYWYV